MIHDDFRQALCMICDLCKRLNPQHTGNPDTCDCGDVSFLRKAILLYPDPTVKGEEREKVLEELRYATGMDNEEILDFGIPELIREIAKARDEADLACSPEDE